MDASRQNVVDFRHLFIHVAGTYAVAGVFHY
jgi:hypothetical protein